MGASVTLRNVINLELIWVKDKKGDFATDSHSILARWRNHFSQLLNVYVVNDVRQTEIPTAEPLVPEPSAFELRWLLKSLKDAYHQVLIKSHQNCLKQGVGQFVLRSININSIWNKKALPEQWNKTIIVALYKKGDIINHINCRGI